ncbi:CRISPR-associated protein Csx20 [Aeribacillus pallidus]|nr:CRISPR-associated protein Csx20 [Aeribacillus pallidus]
MKVLVIMSHKLTEGQKQELYQRFNAESFIDFPEPLKKQWMNIPPVGPWQNEFLKEIKEWLTNQLTKGDKVIVQGEFGATFSLVYWLKKNGYAVYYATTERKVVEEVKPNGTVETIRRFQHVCFREYPDID